MKTITTTIIDAPREIVFLWLDDAERLKQWIPTLVEDEPLTETADKVGSTFKQVYLERGKTMELIGTVTAYTENEHMRADISGKMFDLDIDYVLKALSETQTELTQSTSISFKGGMKFIAPVFGLLAKFSSKDPQGEAHARLKEMAERDYQASI